MPRKKKVKAEEPVKPPVEAPVEPKGPEEEAPQEKKGVEVVFAKKQYVLKKEKEGYRVYRREGTVVTGFMPWEEAERFWMNLQRFNQ